MSKILITGAAGFLGSHLCRRLASDHEVVGVDSMLGGTPDNLEDVRLAEFYYGDCCDLELMRRACKGVQVVYHLAAAPHEGLSVFSPVVVTRNTYLSTVTVATAAVGAGVRRFVFTSSMARYGMGVEEELKINIPFKPFSERQVPAPVDPYGVAKVAAEDCLRVLAEAHGMDWCVAVPHNIYGPGQKYDDPFRNVAAIFINLMLQGRQPFIYGDGNQKRVFSYIDDCIDPLVKMGFERCVSKQVVNIGPDDDPVTINTLAQTIAGLLGFRLSPEYLPARVCEVKEAWPSADKARRLLGYEPRTLLDAGLLAMTHWVKLKKPRPFTYHLPIELDAGGLPRTWKERLM